MVFLFAIAPTIWPAALGGGKFDADLSPSSPDNFAWFANQRLGRDRKSKRGPHDGVDIDGKLGAPGGHIEHLAFVAADIVVKCDPSAVIALFPNVAFAFWSE